MLILSISSACYNQLGYSPQISQITYYITPENIHDRITRCKKQVHFIQMKTNLGTKDIKVPPNIIPY